MPISPPASSTLQAEQDAIAAVMDADPGAALARAEDLLRRSPDLPPGVLLAGQALRRLGRSREALARLKALARAHPRVPAVLWEVAQAASDVGEASRAISALQTLTQLQPRVAGGWFLLARCLRRAGRRPMLGGRICRGCTRPPTILNSSRRP